MRKSFNQQQRQHPLAAATFAGKKVLLAAIVFLASVAGNAQQASPQEYVPRHSLSLEVDPVPFILKGYSFSVKYSHKSLPHWSVMASTFAADFPDGMLSTANKDNGWTDLKFRCSKALFINYHVKKNGKGLFFGPSVFTYNNEVTHSATGETVRFKTVYPNVRVGYTLFPFKKLDLYIAPWVNMGTELRVDGNNKAGGATYKPDSFKYIAALHIGYRYSFDKLFRGSGK